jgi:hypothetical protein
VHGRTRATRRRLIFAAIVSAALICATAYVAIAALRGGVTPEKSGSLATVAREAHVVFQHLRGGAGEAQNAQVALAPLSRPRGQRVMTSLSCARVHFAGGRGLCLVPDLGVIETRYRAMITGANFKARHTIRLTGLPSRARVSPDGRLGAVTAFVTGHSYAQADFSTQTVLIDMMRGSVLADVEKDFIVTRDGKQIKAIDFNFWGITFTRDSKRFYATLRTGGKTYLIEGDISSRRARILRENAECPSISPDNARLAYKKLVGKQWRFHVLDLRTMVEIPLAETNGVDDQVEWLDNHHVLYAFSPPPAVWVVRADGRGTPRKFLSDALSPAVVRD